MPARHKLHSDHDRTPDQEQIAASLAGHEHVRPGLARQASQRSGRSEQCCIAAVRPVLFTGKLPGCTARTAATACDSKPAEAA